MQIFTLHFSANDINCNLHFPHLRKLTPRLLGWVWPNGKWSGGKMQNAITLQQVKSSLIAPLCKPSGLVIIVWCQGALQHSHSQFMNTLCVWTHKGLNKQFPLWPDCGNFTSHCVLQPFLLFFLISRHTNGTRLASLLYANYIKLASNDAEIICNITWIWLSPMATKEKKSMLIYISVTW